MYSIFIVYFYQHSSAQGGAGAGSAVARARRRTGGGGGAQGRMWSRGVGRASGAPSSSLPAARSPSLLTFYEGRDRQQSPSPSHSSVVADGWARWSRCRGAEARRRGGGVRRLDTRGKQGRDTSNKKRASRSATDAPTHHTAASTQVLLQGRIPALGRRGRAGRCRRLHRFSFARLHPCTHPPLPCEWRRVPTGIRPRHLLAARGRWGRPWRRWRSRAVTGSCTRRSRRRCSGAAKGHP